MSELADQLQKLYDAYPSLTPLLDQLQRGARVIRIRTGVWSRYPGEPWKLARG